MGRNSRTRFNHGHIMRKRVHFEFRFSICYISPADVMGNMTLSMRMTICPLEDFFIQHLLHVHQFHEHTPYFFVKIVCDKTSVATNQARGTNEANTFKCWCWTSENGDGERFMLRKSGIWRFGVVLVVTFGSLQRNQTFFQNIPRQVWWCFFFPAELIAVPSCHPGSQAVTQVRCLAHADTYSYGQH